MLEVLVDVWTEELVSGGRIELENFLILEVRKVDRGNNSGILVHSSGQRPAPRNIYRVILKTSKHLRLMLVK